MMQQGRPSRGPGRDDGRYDDQFPQKTFDGQLRKVTHEEFDATIDSLQAGMATRSDIEAMRRTITADVTGCFLHCGDLHSACLTGKDPSKQPPERWETCAHQVTTCLRENCK